MSTATAQKKFRQVFASRQVAHVWAHQSQETGRNAGHTLFFIKQSIYSYGHHFEIARHVEGVDGQKAILFTTRTHSMTTSMHLNHVSRAIPSSATVFRVPLHVGMCGNTPERWFRDYTDSFRESLEKSKKARDNKLYWLNHARQVMTEANSFAEFYGLTDRITLPENYDELKRHAEQLHTARELKNAEKRAREQQLWEIRNAERIEKARRNLTRWINNEPGEGGTASDLYILPKAYFRLKDNDTIETTKGAEFPVIHGERAFRMLAKSAHQMKRTKEMATRSM